MTSSFASRFRRFWSEDGVFLALMLALFALRFWPAFLHGQLYAPFRDNVWLYGSLFSRTSEIALTVAIPIGSIRSSADFPFIARRISR